MTRSATMDEVRSWPLEEQLEFVFDLWDGILESGVRPKPSPELIAELQQRLANYKANPSQTLTWEQVISHLRREKP